MQTVRRLVSPQTYFMGTLTLPIAVGLTGFFVPPLEGITFIMGFAAIPYLACAIVLAALIHRSRTRKQLVWLSIGAPILMGVAMVIFLVIIDPPELRSVSRLFQLMSIFPTIAMVACGFVVLAWIGFAVGVKFNLVGGESPPGKTAPSGDASMRRP